MWFACVIASVVLGGALLAFDAALGWLGAGEGWSRTPFSGNVAEPTWMGALAYWLVTLVALVGLIDAVLRRLTGHAVSGFRAGLVAALTGWASGLAAIESLFEGVGTLLLGGALLLSIPAAIIAWSAVADEPDVAGRARALGFAGAVTGLAAVCAVMALLTPLHLPGREDREIDRDSRASFSDRSDEPERMLRGWLPGRRVVPVKLSNDGPFAMTVTSIRPQGVDGFAPLLRFAGTAVAPANRPPRQREVLVPAPVVRIAPHRSRWIALEYVTDCDGAEGTVSGGHALDVGYRIAGIRRTRTIYTRGLGRIRCG